MAKARTLGYLAVLCAMFANADMAIITTDKNKSIIGIKPQSFTAIQAAAPNTYEKGDIPQNASEKEIVAAPASDETNATISKKANIINRSQAQKAGIPINDNLLKAVNLKPKNNSSFSPF